MDATERQINAHKEQERRKQARGIYWCADLPDNSLRALNLLFQVGAFFERQCLRQLSNTQV